MLLTCDLIIWPPICSTSLLLRTLYTKASHLTNATKPQNRRNPPAAVSIRLLMKSMRLCIAARTNNNQNAHSLLPHSGGIHWNLTRLLLSIKIFSSAMWRGKNRSNVQSIATRSLRSSPGNIKRYMVRQSHQAKKPENLNLAIFRYRWTSSQWRKHHNKVYK